MTEPPEEIAAIQRLVAHHYTQALQLADIEERNAAVALGTPGWLKARWHLHMAQALEGLQRADHAGTMQWLRTKTLNALADGKEFGS